MPEPIPKMPPLSILLLQMEFRVLNPMPLIILGPRECSICHRPLVDPPACWFCDLVPAGGDDDA